jgi:hypothetical protein
MSEKGPGSEVKRDRHADIAWVRSLAEQGVLAEFASRATGPDRRRLTSATYAIAFPILYHYLTRGLEQRRGHWGCASSVERLADQCLDRFHDDSEAVIEDILARATVPIHNLEGWIARHLRRATVDAHRRRRGARGALQRPRLPGWLSKALPPDPWLRRLAIEILVWVGVPTSSGSSVWPLDGWAECRAQVTGDAAGSDAGAVEREVELVLSVMRARPLWYETYVEQPLGGKTPPVANAPVEYDSTLIGAGAPLSLVAPDEQWESQLRSLAAIALDAIELQLTRHIDSKLAVRLVLNKVFCSLHVQGELDRQPYVLGDVDERVTALLDDPAELDRIVTAVLDILRRRRRQKAA